VRILLCTNIMYSGIQVYEQGSCIVRYIILDKFKAFRSCRWSKLYTNTHKAMITLLPQSVLVCWIIRNVGIINCVDEYRFAKKAEALRKQKS
jgi:hypothetical protein